MTKISSGVLEVSSSSVRMCFVARSDARDDGKCSVCVSLSFAA